MATKKASVVKKPKNVRKKTAPRMKVSQSHMIDLILKGMPASTRKVFIQELFKNMDPAERKSFIRWAVV